MFSGLDTVIVYFLNFARSTIHVAVVSFFLKMTLPFNKLMFAASANGSGPLVWQACHKSFLAFCLLLFLYDCVNVLLFPLSESITPSVV